jgi:uncharacterized membrane protein
MSKPARDSKSYKTAAILFAISGLIFIVVGVINLVAGNAPIFLILGIAFVVISMVYRQQSRKMTDNTEEKPDG